MMALRISLWDVMSNVIKGLTYPHWVSNGFQMKWSKPKLSINIWVNDHGFELREHHVGERIFHFNLQNHPYYFAFSYPRNIGLFFKEYWPKSLNEWLHTDQSLLVILSTLFFYLYEFVNIYYVCFPWKLSSNTAL